MAESKHHMAAPGVLHPRAELPTLPVVLGPSIRTGALADEATPPKQIDAARAIVASLKANPVDAEQVKALDSLIDLAKHDKADGTVTPGVYLALVDLQSRRRWFAEAIAALAKLGV